VYGARLALEEACPGVYNIHDQPMLTS
jgi:hypothetical protein